MSVQASCQIIGSQTTDYQTTDYQTTGYQTTGYQTTGYQTTGYQTTGYLRTAALFLFSMMLMAPSAIADTSIAAAVLPVGRSVQVDQDATLFASIVNGGSEVATACGIINDPRLQGGFSYQTTDSATNAVTGALNTPVDIPVGGVQSFLITVSSSASLDPTDIEFGFKCANSPSAPIFPGVNTLLFSASEQPVPDLIALGLTFSGRGTVVMPEAVSVSAFSVASVNVGAAGELEVTAEASQSDLPIRVSVCQTDATTGACLDTAQSGSQAYSVMAGETGTFAVFVSSSEIVPFDPANNRVFVRFRDSEGFLRGATSVALRLRDGSDPLPIDVAKAPALTDTILSDMDVLQKLVGHTLSRLGVFGQSLSFEERCSNSATSETHRLSDSDASLSLSSGDVMTSIYRGCVNRGNFADQLRGETQTLLDRVALTERGDGGIVKGRIVSAEPIEWGSEGNSIDLDLAFTLVEHGSTATLKLGAASNNEGSEYSIRRSNATNRYSGISVERATGSAYDSYDSSIELRLSSDSFRGIVSCFSSRLTGQHEFDGSQAQGTFTCESADGTAMRVQTALDLIETDAARSGEFSAGSVSYGWSGNRSSEMLSSAPRFGLRGGRLFVPPAAVATRLQLAISVVEVSAVTNRVYVANPAGLLVIRPDTGEIEHTVALPHTASSLAVTDDGSTLYIAYKDMGSIQSLNLATMALGAETGLGTDENGVVYEPGFIVPVPGTTDRLIAARTPRGASSFGQELALYISGVAAANTAQQIDAIGNAVFVGSDRLYGVTGRALYPFQVDNNGVTSARQQITGTGLETTRPNRLSSHSNLLFGGLGVAFDADKVQILGTYKAPGVFGGFDALVHDPVGNRSYRLDSQLLTVFDAKRFTPLGQFSVNTDAFSVHDFKRLDFLNGHVVGAYDNELVFIDTTQLPLAAESSCQAINLADVGISTNTHFQTCAATDVLFHAATGRFVAALSGSVGTQGNSLAVIVPETGEIERVIPVGSDPKSLALAADGKKIYVSFEDINLLARVNPADGMVEHVATLVKTRDQDEFGEDYIRFDITRLQGMAASPTELDSVMLAWFETNPVLYRQGELHETPGTIYFTASKLFYSEQVSGKGYGTDQNGNLMLFNISETGVSTTAVVSDLLVGRQTEYKNGFIYSVGRQKLDPATLSITQTYEFPDDESRSFPRGVLVVDDQVLFLIDTRGESPSERYAAFDEASGDYLGLRNIPQLGGFFDSVSSDGIKTATSEDGQWIALAGPGGVLVVPFSELVHR